MALRLTNNLQTIELGVEEECNNPVSSCPRSGPGIASTCIYLTQNYNPARTRWAYNLEGQVKVDRGVKQRERRSERKVEGRV